MLAWLRNYRRADLAGDVGFEHQRMIAVAHAQVVRAVDVLVRRGLDASGIQAFDPGAVHDPRVRLGVPVVPGREALLVSHQLPVWTTRLWLEGRSYLHDPRRRQCSLASLTSLTFDGRTLVGLAYWEPAGDLLRSAEDMVPGTSAAAEKIGDGSGAETRA